MRKTTKQIDLNEWMGWGISTRDKTIWLGSSDKGGQCNGEGETGIDYQLAERVVKGLYLLDSIEPKRPINILMNCVGGDVFHGFAIYDTIKSCESKVVVSVVGQAMSMGAVILQAATLRRLSKSSRVMIHAGQSSLSGKPEDMRSWARHFDMIDQHVFNILLARLKEKNRRFNENTLREWLRKDTVFTASQAVDIGLADEVF